MFDLIIPCIYSDHKKLQKTIESFKHQELLNNIIIILNNIQGNTFKKIIHDKIKYLEYNEKILPGIAREIGIKKSKSEFIVFHDADDEAHPDKLLILKHCFLKYNCDHILHFFQPLEYDFIKYDLNKIKIIDTITIKKFYHITKSTDFGDIVGRRVSHGLIAVRKNTVININWENIPSGEDKDFNLKSLNLGNKLIMVDCLLSKYDRYHSKMMIKYHPKTYSDLILGEKIDYSKYINIKPFKGKITIINPSWDHSEVTASLLKYFYFNNYFINIIYNWEHNEGNYFDYFIKDLNIGNYSKIKFTNIKNTLKDIKGSKYIIFIDEVHLKKIFSKLFFREKYSSIYCINHITKKIIYPIKLLSLGKIPFERCVNTDKYLINSLFKPSNVKIKMTGIKNYLVVGNPIERHVDFLEKLPSDNYFIYFVSRKDFEIKNKNVIKIINYPTEKLMRLLSEKIHYIITLFKNDSVYHKDRISGIVPFSYSFGIPLIADSEYVKLSDEYVFKKFIYNNTVESFKNVFLKSLEIDYNKYQDYHDKLINYRDIKIKYQENFFKKIFSHQL